MTLPESTFGRGWQRSGATSDFDHFDVARKDEVAVIVAHFLTRLVMNS